ncbi:RHS repeat-associated core domain-containing protein [Dictyobacter kobayashii]|uniref:RHS repeat-associated core domain-containing protein n=1 Tax=Dictyobacter kobayashii TaxID=2014872 RepID=A0A402AVS6_9CHLR|nr:RHS repeat-associated core domain-containing protein [Dictyobacter kobayashii]GCE23123.1 hypothetical protein KDK_69230 [Dictyobacter kobayashii]
MGQTPHHMPDYGKTDPRSFNVLRIPVAQTEPGQLFSPFGATRYSDGTMLSPFNFTGQRLDTQTGLLYYNARYYDANSRRFTSADTVETNMIGLVEQIQLDSFRTKDKL